MPFDRELNTALEAVRQACRLCEAVQATLVDADTHRKADRSPVTIADYGAQALINRALEEAFPDDPIVGEEDATALRLPDADILRAAVVRQVHAILPAFGERHILSSIDRGAHVGGPSGRFWTLDPIDGTKGFIRKEQYAVALALIEDGHVRLGVLGCPNLPSRYGADDGSAGLLFHAVKGQGAFVQPLRAGETPRAIRVDAIERIDDAVVCEPVESAHSAPGLSAKIAQSLGWTRPSVRLDSQCKYAVLARGEAHAYLRLPTREAYEEKIWDHAAGFRIVVEAGGQVSDIHGKPMNFALGRTLAANQGIVATSGGAVHRQVLHAISSLS